MCDTETRALTAPRDYIAGSLTCRVTDEDSCGDKFDTFLERCYYQPGQYAEESDFKALSDRMSETEKVKCASQSAWRFLRNWTTNQASMLKSLDLGSGKITVRRQEGTIPVYTFFQLQQWPAVHPRQPPALAKGQGLLWTSLSAIMRLDPVMQSFTGSWCCAGQEKGQQDILPIHPALHLHSSGRLRVPGGFKP